ncbi:MAG: GEVED domain-containing protein [Flavobacterium sp.]
MKKITLLIAFLLSAMLSGYSQQVQSYSRAVLTGQTYTPIAGGTVINTNAGLTPGIFSGNQDDGGVLVTLPFTFTYGGNTFTQATFTTNGWVGLGNQAGVTAAESRAPGNLFTATAPNNTIAAWFGDLGANFPQGPGAMVHGLVGTDAYAFEWRNAVGTSFSQINVTVNFMVIIYGPASATPGRIELLYGNTTGNVVGGRAIGIENGFGGTGNFINAVNGSNYLTNLATAWPGNGNGYRFDPVTFSCTAPTGGTIAGGTTVYACSGSAPAQIMTVGATPSATGVSYQWEQSTNGGTTWTLAVGGTGNTTPNYTPPTFNGTAIQYRLAVKCGSLTGYSEVATVADGGVPGVQVSGLITQASQAAGITATWTNGNGNRRVVIVSTSPIADRTNAPGPALTAATVYTSGEQVVYDGTGTTVTVTGIPCAGGTYYVRVFELVRCGSAAPYSYYYNNTAAGSSATVTIAPATTAPAVQVSGLLVSNTADGFTASWVNGTGGRRVVYVSTTPITDPVDGTGAALTASTSLATGSGPWLVYDGTGASVTTTGLTCTTGGTYYIKVYEYDRCGTAAPYTYAYNTTTGTNAVTHVRESGSVAPATQASALILTKGIGQFTAAWTNGSGTRRVVLVSTSPIVAPVNGTGPALTAATSVATGSGPWTVYDGTGSTVTVTGVPCTGGTYYVQVFEYNRCGTAAPYTFAYNTTSGTNAGSIDMTLAAPTAATQSLNVTSTPGSLNLSWSNGNGSRRMVVVSQSPIVDPVDGTGPALTAAAAYAGGEQIVYDNTGSSVTVTGIPCSGGTFYIKVYEYNRCGSAAPYTYAYNVSTGSNAATFVVAPTAAPTVQASGITLTPTAGQVAVSFANGNGNYRFVYVDTNPITAPIDEVGIAAPTADTSFNDEGLQLVYNGTGSSVTVTGLSCLSGDVYYIKVFEVNRCGVTGAFDYTFNTTTGTNEATLNITGPTTQASALAATTVTFNSAVLTWTAGNGGRRIVVVSDAAITDPADESGVPALTALTAYQGGQQVVYDGTGTTVTVTGLTCGTTYNIKVYEVGRCGTTDNYTYTYNVTAGTNAITVTPQVPTVALPQSTSFVGFTGANLPATSTNWLEARIPTTAGDTPTNVNPGGVTSDWLSSTAFGTTTTARVNLIARTKNEWIISPKVTITGASRVKFKAAITAAGSAAAAAATSTMAATDDDAVNVLISTDCGMNWTPLHVFSAGTVGSLTNSLVDFSFPIDGAYIGQNVQVAFQATDGPVDETPSYDFHIGDVVIELVPSCDTPSVIVDAVSTITENGATVAWGVPATSTPTGYQYTFSPDNTAPTTAGTPTSATSATINTLASSTQYYTWVRTVCGAQFSNWVMVGAFKTLCDAPEVLTTVPATRCGEGTVQLAATTSEGATLSWYAAETGGAALGTGPTFTTPSISANTTYYVAAATGGGTSTLGPANYLYGGTVSSIASPSTSYYAIFNATAETKIQSVTVFATAAGQLNLQLANSAGTVLQTFNYTITAAQANSTTTVLGTPIVVPVNFDVPVGTALRLGIASGTTATILRNTSGATSYYNVAAGGVTFTGNWFADNTYWYFFYDITISSACSSVRTPVLATVTTAPVITAEAQTPTLCSGQSTNLNVSSGNANYTYVWMPGNLTGATQTVSPTATTVYTVTATDSGTGCVATQIVTVTVNQSPTPVSITGAASACANQVVALTGTGGVTGTTAAYCTPALTVTQASGDYLNNFSIANLVNNNSGDTATDYTYYNALTANVVAGSTYPVSFEAGGVTSTFQMQFGVWIDVNQNGTFEDSELLYASTTATFSPTVTTGSITIPPTALNGVTRMRVGARYNTAITASQSCALPSQFGEYEDYNVSITGGVNAVNYVFSPTAGLYTNAAATVAYTGTPVQMVYAKNTANATYTATVTAVNGCTASDDHTVTINGANTPTGATSQTVAANSPAEATIEDIVVAETGVIWYATEANAIAGVNPLAAGTQVFAGSVYYGTLSTGSCTPLAVTITEVLGSKGFDKTQFSFYPNPVKDVLNLKYSNEISEVEVYNLLGQKIISKKINSTEATLDMAGIADGNYIVIVTSGSESQTLKIVKKQ